MNSAFRHSARYVQDERCCFFVAFGWLRALCESVMFQGVSRGFSFFLMNWIFCEFVKVLLPSPIPFLTLSYLSLYNILLPYIDSLATQRAVRYQSTKAATPEVSTTFLTLGPSKSFSKTWLSDPSTYPLLVCLAGAGGLCAGVAVYFLAANPDVQINTRKRGSIIRE